MKPVNRTVIVQYLKLSTTKADIETTTKEADRHLVAGEIVSVSDEVKEEWKKGMKVVFGKYAPASFKMEGEEYHFLPIDDIVGLL